MINNKFDLNKNTTYKYIMTKSDRAILLVIQSLYNTRLDNQNYTHITLNELEDVVNTIKKPKGKKLIIKPKKVDREIIKLPFKPKTPPTPEQPEPKKLIIKPNKLIIKPKPTKVKQKKLIIKEVNLPEPSDFKNEYQYFVAICSLINQKVYKYETTMWDGPAIIVHLFDNFNNKIKNKFKINIVVDTLSNSKIAIYPCKNTLDTTIIYEDMYMNEIETEKFEYKIQGKYIYIDVETQRNLDNLNELERAFYINQLM